MALIIDLTVTRRGDIMTIEVRRLDPLACNRVVYTYEATLYELGHGAHRLGTIDHAYTAGVVPLAQAALAMAGRWLAERGVAQ